MTKTQRVNARLDESRAGKLAALCRETGASVTEVIQEAIDVMYERHRQRATKAKEIFERVGFIGAAEGPPDLSETYRSELTELLEKKHGDR